LLVAALVLPAWQKREAIIALHPAIARAKLDAESTDALARKLERQVADYNFVQAKRHAPLALAYIEDLSRLLPDNTWVQQFDLRTAGKAREVQISGESASASKLIELLEQSTLLQNAAPRGPFTRGSQPGTERFLIAAETRIKPPPDALPARDVVLLPPAAAAVVPAVQVPPAAEAPSEAPSGAPAEGSAVEPAAKSDPVAAPPETIPAIVQPLAPPHPPQLSPEARAQGAERARRLREQVQDRQKAAEDLRRRRQQPRSDVK
jgi:general secretion pathway protein L